MAAPVVGDDVAGPDGDASRRAHEVPPSEMLVPTYHAGARAVNPRAAGSVLI